MSARNPELSTIAKRRAVLAQVEATATAHGATVQVESGGKGEYSVRIAKGPFACRVELRAFYPVGLFAPWWTDLNTDAKFPAEFAFVASVNPYHGRKASMFAPTVPAFLDRLARGLDMISA